MTELSSLMPLVANKGDGVRRLWGIELLFHFQALLQHVYSDNPFPILNVSGICGSNRNTRTKSCADVFH